VLIIETASIDDAPTIARLIRAAFAKQVRELGIDETTYPNYVGFETEARVRHRIAQGVRIALASSAAECVGTVSWVWAGTEAEPGEIMRLGVLSEQRGKGYGRELMVHAETELRAAGARVARIGIVARFVRLRSYYEELGYAAVESRQFPTLPFEVLFMERRIPSAR
jgi:GNAT superfamily N-acetyltransferase